MTDRINAIVVVLEKDMREDDAEPILNAIRQMRGVLDVRTNIADPLLEPIIRMRCAEEIMAVLRKMFYGNGDTGTPN